MNKLKRIAPIGLIGFVAVAGGATASIASASTVNSHHHLPVVKHVPAKTTGKSAPRPYNAIHPVRAE